MAGAWTNQYFIKDDVHIDSGPSVSGTKRYAVAKCAPEHGQKDGSAKQKNHRNAPYKNRNGRDLPRQYLLCCCTEGYIFFRVSFIGSIIFAREPRECLNKAHEGQPDVIAYGPKTKSSMKRKIHQWQHESYFEVLLVGQTLILESCRQNEPFRVLSQITHLNCGANAYTPHSDIAILLCARW